MASPRCGLLANHALHELEHRHSTASRDAASRGGPRRSDEVEVVLTSPRNGTLVRLFCRSPLYRNAARALSLRYMRSVECRL